jgi:hypothetical protein
MKRLLISGFVAVALLAVATSLRSHSIVSEGRSHATSTGGKPTLAGVRSLPIEEFEDMTFVFSEQAKH